MRTVTALLFLILGVFTAEARPIKFGFYYTPDMVNGSGEDSNIQARIHDLITRTSEEFSIKIKIAFIKPLPFPPPLITPPGEKNEGISELHLLQMFKSRKPDQKKADYFFIITSLDLWKEGDYDAASNKIKYRTLAGSTFRNSDFAVFAYPATIPQNIAAEVLWHEWGHLYPMDLPDKFEQDGCTTTRLLMCASLPDKPYRYAPLIIEKSFRDAVQKTAEYFENQRD